jgi:hypothetical protein
MKKFLIVLGIVVISLAGITFFKNLIVKTVITTAATHITGAPVHMDGFSWNIFSSAIRISGFKMYNPSGFPRGILVSCPKINVIYDRATLFKQKRHLLLVEIDLKELGLTKNKTGKLNVDSLKIVQQSHSSPPTPMQIDLVNLSIGKIVYKDYTAGSEPAVRVYDVSRHKSYKGIPTAQQLAVLVIAEPMKSAAIKNAEIYGVALVAGVAVLPVAVAATFAGKDNIQQIIDAVYADAYKTSLEAVKRMGSLTKEDASNGVIKANINGAMVALHLREKPGNKTEITISARKYMLPKPDIAAGVLYQVLDKIR